MPPERRSSLERLRSAASSAHDLIRAVSNPAILVEQQLSAAAGVVLIGAAAEQPTTEQKPRRKLSLRSAGRRVVMMNRLKQGAAVVHEEDDDEKEDDEEDEHREYLGRDVVLCGLRSHTALNGRKARAIRWDEDKKRMGVLVDGHGEGLLWATLVHIRLASEPPPEGGDVSASAWAKEAARLRLQSAKLKLLCDKPAEALMKLVVSYPNAVNWLWACGRCEGQKRYDALQFYETKADRIATQLRVRPHEMNATVNMGRKLGCVSDGKKGGPLDGFFRFDGTRGYECKVLFTRYMDAKKDVKRLEAEQPHYQGIITWLRGVHKEARPVSFNTPLVSMGLFGMLIRPWALYRHVTPLIGSALLSVVAESARPLIAALLGRRIDDVPGAFAFLLPVLIAAPQLALEVKWARSLLPAGPPPTRTDELRGLVDEEEPGGGVLSAVSRLPKWLFVARSLCRLPTQWEFVQRLLPAHHPLHEPRSLMTSINRTWLNVQIQQHVDAAAEGGTQGGLLAELVSGARRHMRRLLAFVAYPLAHLLNGHELTDLTIPTPDLTFTALWRQVTWSFWSGLPIMAVSIGIKIGVAAAYARIRQQYLVPLFLGTTVASHQKALKHAEERADSNGVALVDVSMLERDATRQQPRLVRKNSMALKMEVVKGLQEKKMALWQRIMGARDHLKASIRAGRHGGMPMLMVKRDDPLPYLYYLSKIDAAQLRFGRLQVAFGTDPKDRSTWEPAQDVGGVFKEFMAVVAEALPSSPLLHTTADGSLLPSSTARHAEEKGDDLPSPDRPGVEHPAVTKKLLKGLGRLLGLTIIRDVPLPVSFSRCLYKVLLAEAISAQDVSRVDPTFAQHRVHAVLKPGGVAEMEAILCDELTFVGVAMEAGGDEEGEELVPGGSKIRVTEENKRTYCALLVEQYLVGHARAEVAALAEGFYEVLPANVIRGVPGLTALDLELLCAGMPDIDVDDWRKHTRWCIGISGDGPDGGKKRILGEVSISRLRMASSRR